MLQTTKSNHLLPAYALVLAATGARLLPHPPNVTPVAAVALFGGCLLRPRWLALTVPLAAMVLSDYLIGWHRLVAWTWGGMLLTGVLGLWLRRRAKPARVAAASVAGSTLFFLITNFGVWWVGAEGAYPHTVAGLLACYAAAVPFYRNALLGDLGYAAALFGAYRLCCALWFRESSRPVPVRAA